MFSNSNKQKKINETKLNIFRLATECTEEISSNRQNLEKNEIIKSMIKKYKFLLLKFSNKNSTISKNEIKNDLNEINNQIKLKNIEIQMKNLKIEEKIKDLNLRIEKNFFNLNNELNLLKESNFLLQNSLKEKNFLINLLKNNLKQSKDHFIFREEIRENFLENKIEGENFYFDYLFNLQEFLHFKCKKFNFFYNKNIQKLKTKLNLINTINYIKNQKNIQKLFDLNSNQVNHQNLLKIFKRSNSFEKKFLNNENNNNNKNNSKIEISNILNSFLTIDEILISNENNNIIIEEDLNSDEEFSFPNKIKYKFAEYKNIPSLNLKQIEYNKYKNQKEIDLYSKERRINSDQNEEQIKLIKKNIKKIKKNIKQNEIKIKNYENVIKDFKNNIFLLTHFRNNSFNFNNNIFINKNNNYLKKHQNKIKINYNNNSFLINDKINNNNNNDNIFIINDNKNINNSF